MHADKNIRQIMQISKVITEDPDIILEANAAETKQFKELITNIDYNGPTALEPLNISVAGVERQYYEEEDIVRTDIIVHIHHRGASTRFHIPVTEKIIQAVLQDPRNAARTIANVTTAWGAINAYRRWLKNEQQTPRPTQMRNPDGTYFDTRRATPEQQRRVDAYIQKQDHYLEIIGRLLDQYGLSDEDYDE